MTSFEPNSIAKLAEDYVRWDPNEETRGEVQSLLEAGNFAQLNSILGSRLAFGTAGLRGPMGKSILFFI